MLIICSRKETKTEHNVFQFLRRQNIWMHGELGTARRSLRYPSTRIAVYEKSASRKGGALGVLRGGCSNTRRIVFLLGVPV